MMSARPLPLDNNKNASADDDKCEDTKAYENDAERKETKNGR